MGGYRSEGLVPYRSRLLILSRERREGGGKEGLVSKSRSPPKRNQMAQFFEKHSLIFARSYDARRRDLGEAEYPITREPDKIRCTRSLSLSSSLRTLSFETPLHSLSVVKSLSTRTTLTEHSIDLLLPATSSLLVRLYQPAYSEPSHGLKTSRNSWPRLPRLN